MAINTKTFPDKVNTIVKDSPVNLSLNPVMELNYGGMLTRGMLHFDVSKLKGMVDDKTYPDMGKLKHVLRMTNAASVNDRGINCRMFASDYDGYKQRAVSFDIILFLIPNDWDSGRGFDYAQDLHNKSSRGLSIDGSNWYQYANYMKWDEEGIYSTDSLSREVDLFTSFNGNMSDIVIAYQHFDVGNEPIEIDITDTFNKWITGELCNYGIGIAFSPKFEETKTKMTQYVGFFTQHTNSFYEPYVETTYDDYISDDRGDFYLDKDNRLYFYASIGGKPVNLDTLPVCVVDGVEHEVRQQTIGVYYIEIRMPSSEYEAEEMHYDVWSGIRHDGRDIPDLELSFVTKPSAGYYSFGLPDNSTPSYDKFVPSLYGVSNREKIRRGDVRKVTVECKIPYTTKQLYAVEHMEYRLYTMQGESEIDVIAYSPVERAYNCNYFLIDTSQLIPSRYYVDIKVKYGFEELYHRDLIEFDIVNDKTEVFV